MQMKVRVPEQVDYLQGGKKYDGEVRDGFQALRSPCGSVDLPEAEKFALTSALEGGTANSASHRRMGSMMCGVGRRPLRMVTAGT